MGILDFFPDDMSPRPEQRQLLLEIEKIWDRSDVIVVAAPVAVGKSAVAATIANWQSSRLKTTTIATPYNTLLDQYGRSFPDYKIIRNRELYVCKDHDRSCGDTKSIVGLNCSDCPYQEAKREVKESLIRLATVHGYVAHKLYSDVVIFDECHTLPEYLRNNQIIRLWRSKYHFPANLQTVADVIEWALSFRTKKMDHVAKSLSLIKHGSIVEYLNGSFRGKPDVLLEISATSSRTGKQWLWPGGRTEKIILMSGTVGEADIADLGLYRYRVSYLTCGSPIPVQNRPIVGLNSVNMAYRYRAASVGLLAKQLKILIDSKPGQKGLIHAPYAVAAELKKHMQDDSRIIWHGRNNKTKKLEEFRNSDPSTGAVLVASGMYEGIDLPYDFARWQVITVVPYPPLGEEWIKERAESDPEWYAWETIKSLVQASGRIVRAEDDFGVTYIADSQFQRLWSGWRDLFPAYFKDAVSLR